MKKQVQVKIDDIRKKCIEFLETRSLDPLPPYRRRQIYAEKKKAARKKKYETNL